VPGHHDRSNHELRERMLDSRSSAGRLRRSATQIPRKTPDLPDVRAITCRTNCDRTNDKSPASACAWLSSATILISSFAATRLRTCPCREVKVERASHTPAVLAMALTSAPANPHRPISASAASNKRAASPAVGSPARLRLAIQLPRRRSMAP